MPAAVLGAFAASPAILSRHSLGGGGSFKPSDLNKLHELRLSGHNWGEVDPAAAEMWMDSLDDADRQKFAEGLILGVDGSRPDLAAELAAQEIKDPARRTELIGRNLIRWSERDTPAALSWFNSVSIDEATRRTILGLIASGWKE